MAGEPQGWVAGSLHSVSEQDPADRHTWFPLALAGGFLVFALVVAFLAYAAHRKGNPSRASSVDDVAELSIEAVDRADREFAAELTCQRATAELIAFVPSTRATASKSRVKGVESGSFLLKVGADSWEITVGRDGERSCIQSVAPVSGAH